jgi:transposase InsO family protein
VSRAVLNEQPPALGTLKALSPIRLACRPALATACWIPKAGIEPFAVVYADFTELPYAGGQQKGCLIVLIDHATKIVVGWAVGNRKTTEVALQAWERAKQTLATCAGSRQGMIVHHDQDPVFVGYQWTSRLLLDDGVRVSYSLRGARGNPEIEAFFSRFETENGSGFSMVDLPFSIDGWRAGRLGPPPAVGQHTDEVLGEAGYSTAEIAALRGRGTVA